MTIGNDRGRLLTAVYQVGASPRLREIPAVDIVRRVWFQNYLSDGLQLHWHQVDNIPPAAKCISSPYDLEAHHARQHTTQWVGYKVQITDTCEDD